jgi:hypothetical protein
VEVVAAAAIMTVTKTKVTSLATKVLMQLHRTILYLHPLVVQ